MSQWGEELVLAVSNLTLGSSVVVVVFIKQIISAPASNPQNNFGSVSETLVKCSIFFYLFVGGCSAGWSSCTEAG